ncbi:N-terminal acetyltransferase A complex catalytic subunit ard1 [Cryptotrichosporon argae]
MDIRQATIDDLLGMQNANLLNLPENYTFKYYLYHALTWPELSYVAVDPAGRVVGYILAKMEEEPSDEPSGHVTSISVLRPYRRLGLANKLMKQSQEAMVAHYNAAHITLNVRKSNRAAISLYRDSLGFEVTDVNKAYYADGEDSYGMKLVFKKADA